MAALIPKRGSVRPRQTVRTGSETDFVCSPAFLGLYQVMVPLTIDVTGVSQGATFQVISGGDNNLQSVIMDHEAMAESSFQLPGNRDIPCAIGPQP